MWTFPRKPLNIPFKTINALIIIKTLNYSSDHILKQMIWNLLLSQNVSKTSTPGVRLWNLPAQ
jgi:hypothetical protein